MNKNKVNNSKNQMDNDLYFNLAKEINNYENQNNKKKKQGK